MAKDIFEIDPTKCSEEEAHEALLQKWTEEMIERKLQGRTYVELLATYQRFADPDPSYKPILHSADGSLIVGEGYADYTPEIYRKMNANRIADEYIREYKDLRISIALGRSPEPRNESVEERRTRLLETRLLAYRLAAQGEFSVAIELGYMHPKVEPQPRLVDADGKVVQEEVPIEF